MCYNPLKIAEERDMIRKIEKDYHGQQKGRKEGDDDKMLKPPKKKDFGINKPVKNDAERLKDEAVPPSNI